jgi:hypothetical protein
MSARAAVGIEPGERTATSLPRRLDVVLDMRAATLLAAAFLCLASASAALERLIVVVGRRPRTLRRASLQRPPWFSTRIPG